MSFIAAAARTAPHLSVVSDEPSLRLIAYLWFPQERQPRRQVVHVHNVDAGRTILRHLFVDHDEVTRAELWDEDLLVARLHDN